VAADAREARILVQRRALQAKPFAVHHVVGIHARDERFVARRES